MTLRQLIAEIKRLDLVDDIAVQLTDHKSKTVKRVIHELYDLPGDDELSGCDILIDQFESDVQGIKETIVDVCIREGETKWAMDLTDWNSLIDLNISDKICNTLTERLCNVLYEITFWGTSRNAILQQINEMQQDYDEQKDNLITVTLEEFLEELDELK